MSESKSIPATPMTLQAASAITTAYFTNLLRLQIQGQDTNNKEVQEQCMKETERVFLETIEFSPIS